MHVRSSAGNGKALSAIMLAMCAVAGCQAPITELVGKPAPAAVTLSSAQFDDIGFTSATLTFDLAVTNPNATALPLASADYRITSEGREILSGSEELTISAPPNQSTTVRLPVRIDYEKLLGSATNNRRGDVIPYKAEITVAVKAPVAHLSRLPATHSGVIPIPAVPEIRSVDVKWDGLSADQASGVIVVRLANPNSFPISISKLWYSLTAGGAPLLEASATSTGSFGPDGGENTIELPVTIVPRNLGAALAGIATGAKAEYSLEGALELNTPFGIMDVPLGR